VLVVIQSLLEDTTTQVIYLPQQNLLDGQTKPNVFDPRLHCILGESGSFEGAV
jgi:hypothetical protein